MNNLDNIDFIKKLDEENILGNTQEMPEQIKTCWDSWKKMVIPSHYINAKTVLILGMGGSGIGAALVSSLAEKFSQIPFIILKDYDIPQWVDKNTLVIAVSYSGNTEETLEAFSQAALITDKLITISTGGKLAALSSQHRAVHYQINYGSQPRAALGFSFTSLLAICYKLKFIEFTEEDINEAVILLKALIKRIDVDVVTSQNNAKLLAQKLYGKIPVITGSGFLSPVACRWKQHINENAKNCAYFEAVPEMNHNALVGLQFPKALNDKIFFVILQSNYDHGRNKLRANILGQILQQRKIGYETVMLHPSGNIIAEMLQVILLGDFVAYYLAILNNIAPNPVDAINFLKDKLAEVPFERNKNV